MIDARAPADRIARRLLVASLVVSLVCLGRSGRAASPGSAEVLANFPSLSGSFDVAIDRCHPEAKTDIEAMRGCPFQVRWSANGKVHDTVAIGHPACGAPSAATNHVALGVTAAAKLWATEGEWCDVEVAAQVVRLAADQNGILVSQKHGVESIAHEHWLFAGHAGRLVRLWATEDEMLPAGEVRVVSSPSGPATDDVIVVQTSVAEGDSDEVTKRIRVRRLHWDRSASALVTSVLPANDFSLYLAYLGPYKDLAAARAVADRQSKACYVTLGIAPAALFPGLGLRGLLRAGVFAVRQEAEERKTLAARCPPDLIPRIIEYAPNAAKAAEFTGHPLKIDRGRVP